MVKKTKKPSLLLTLGAAALLAGGGGAAFYVLTQRGFGSADLPVGAEVIPQDALMTISVSTDPGQWQQLREFGTPQSQTALDQNLAKARDRLLTANGIDYDRDIKPWLGKEVTVAFLSPQATPPPSGNPNTLPPVPQAQQSTILVLPIQDALKAKQTLENFKPQSGNVSERDYKGFQIRETQGATAQKFSATVLDAKLVVVTNDAKAMDRAIDTYKGEPALAATPNYVQAMRKIQAPQPFGKLFFNVSAAVAATSANADKSISPQTLAQLQQRGQGMAATAVLESEGIRFKGISWLKPNSPPIEVRNTAKTMPTRFPADTIVMVSGGSLKRLWRDYTQGGTVSPVYPINAEWLRTALKSSANVDLDQDLLTWMDGEFALAIVATPPENPSRLPVGLVFMVQSSDRRVAEKSLSQLDQTLASKPKLKVEESRVNDQIVTAVKVGQSPLTIAHGWLDSDVAFLTLGIPVEMITPRPTKSLADSDIFKQVVSSDLNPNNGHFFVDLSQANAKNLPLMQFPPGSQEIVAAVRTIGVTAAISDDLSTRYDVMVQLQKGSSPKPLPSPTIPSGSTNVPGGKATPTPILPPVASPSPQ